jgi:hypothetical protein
MRFIFELSRFRRKVLAEIRGATRFSNAKAGKPSAGPQPLRMSRAGDSTISPGRSGHPCAKGATSNWSFLDSLVRSRTAAHVQEIAACV